MVKFSLFLGIILAAFIADATCQRYILPIYRPPVNRSPIIRRVREAVDKQELEWKPPSFTEPRVTLSPEDMDVIVKRRYGRSKDSPSAKGYGGGHSSSGGSRDTGATHPGYNRRNARSIRPPGFDFEPLPLRPSVSRELIGPRTRFPIHARTARDIQYPGIKKPTHRDIIIPNWNPHVHTNPWQRIGGSRKSRSLGNPGKEDYYNDYYDVLRQEQ